MALRDTALFILGVAIISRQAGIYFDPPEDVSIELLAIGALCCNIPGILQVIAWRSTGTSSSPPEQPAQRSQPPPLPAPYSGGEG